MKPFERNVSSPHGAPMGRRSDPIEEFEGRVHLERVPMVDGDYDAGGAYWGGGSNPVYCAWDDAGHEHYLRARDLDAAKRQFPATILFDRGGDRDAVVRGIARIMWGEAWAGHAEEHGCQHLGGMEITSAMPEIPVAAFEEAEEIAGAIEKENGKTMDEILAEASAADGYDPDPDDFGGDLALMYMGTGSSWFDNHEKFPLKAPYGETSSDLRFYADEHCENESDKIPCKNCGVYAEPGEKCSNCGKVVREPARPRGAVQKMKSRKKVARKRARKR